MAPFPPPPAAVVLGWLHTLGMGTLIGGTLLAWALHRTDRLELPPAAALQLAATYESVFWAGAGLVVIAGVARVGAVVDGGPAGTLAVGAYCLALLVLLAGSLVRTFGVAELRRGSLPAAPDPGLARLRGSYAITAAVLLIVAALAEVAAVG